MHAGVESVETDLGNDRVVVKGVIEGSKLVEYVYKRTGKQASIVKDEEKKEEDKKEEDKKEEDKKKEEDDEHKEEDNDQTDMIKRMEYWPSKYFTEYAYDPQIFSDENPNACSIMWSTHIFAYFTFFSCILFISWEGPAWLSGTLTYH